MKFLKERLKSDKGALNSTEVLMLIALSVFAVLAITKFVITPMIESSEGIGLEIEAMDPRN